MSCQSVKAAWISSGLAPRGSGPRRPGFLAIISSVAPGAAAAVDSRRGTQVSHVSLQEPQLDSGFLST